MSSRKNELLIGSQTPRIRIVPEYSRSDGYDLIEFAENYSNKPDKWQANVLLDWMALDNNDMWLSTVCGLSAPRQNGKTVGLVEEREIFGLVFYGEQILHTAHEVKTMKKSFVRIRDFFKKHRKKEIRDLLAEVRSTNGQEAIFLTNGASVEFIARTKSSGLGFTKDLLVFDEAQELTDDQLEAILPTISAAPLGNPQRILIGTPPKPSVYGDVFRRTRKTAIEGKSKRTSWHEWSVDKIGDVHDKSRWFATNPALGIRLNVAVVEDESTQMTEDGFARERLGWWSEQTAKAVVGRCEWDALITEVPPKDGRVAYGVKFSKDGSAVALAVALKTKDGRTHVEVIEHRSMSHGISWLVDWLAERWRDATVIVIDGLTGAGALVRDLLDRGVSKNAIVTPKAGEVISAHSMIHTAIKEETLTHFNQPALNESILNAQKRAIGSNGGWGWDGINDVDVSLIDAVTLAHWGVKTSKRRPGRKSKVI